MLFQIDESIPQAFKDGVADDDDARGLGYLLLGISEGSHRISGTRAVLRNVLEFCDLGKQERPVIERAMSRIAQEGHLPYRFSTIARVALMRGVDEPTCSREGGRRIISFPLRWFDISAKIQPTVLLAENLSDLSVLGKIGEVSMTLAGLGYLPLRYEKSSGGGSTTGVILEHLAGLKKLCLCIVDSDRTFPESQVGGTARRLEPFCDWKLYPLVRVRCTRGRDLENALPDSFYEARYKSNESFRPLSSLLSGLTRTGEHDLRWHLDIEKGLSLYDFSRCVEGSAEREFWYAKQGVIAALCELTLRDLPCFKLGHCPREKRHECTCSFVSGITANVLDDFAKYAERKDRYELREELHESLRSEWLAIGTDVVSWCCADDRLRI